LLGKVRAVADMLVDHADSEERYIHPLYAALEDKLEGALPTTIADSTPGSPNGSESSRPAAGASCIGAVHT
jgi:hypothetical protein